MTARPPTKSSASTASASTIGLRLRQPSRVGGLVARLNELGVEHGGIVDTSYGSGLSFRDPDGVTLEFFAPPG